MIVLCICFNVYLHSCRAFHSELGGQQLLQWRNFHLASVFLPRLATKTKEQAFCSCLDVHFHTDCDADLASSDDHSALPSGQHRVRQHVLMEHSNFISGTRVSLYMLLPAHSSALSYGMVTMTTFWCFSSVTELCVQ